MRLLITSPTAIVVDDSDVVSVRAEDASGGFGILRGHADLLTALSVSIVAWQAASGHTRYCAVRRGVLSVTGGNEVGIATAEAVPGDDLGQLEQIVLDEFRRRAEAERASRVQGAQLQMKAIRQIVQYLRPDPNHLREGGA
ncbi:MULTISPECIES: F0F1 ATP synthase subunit epsilon [Bradyrhizobium]|uniref:F0F1 ATP synthase subunit epsilon n=1 Tax=Bradyrhizobium TaxID=374 RepID=UPI0004B7D996|nr:MULTISPECIES: F0F1 ATP synthase subunit epsilon [unclassified Bradyrhizobium]MDA9421313.1 ATP synthase F0F1 subunit epsilon [Bradyrhizobium sp. CCBAU 53380]